MTEPIMFNYKNLKPEAVPALPLVEALRILTIMNGPTDACPTEAADEYCNHCAVVRALRAHVKTLWEAQDDGA